jgi:uncharacterized protein (TIGR03435 family)
MPHGSPREAIRFAVGIAVIAGSFLSVTFNVRAQSSDAAAGKMSFEVASVKRDMACTPHGVMVTSRDTAPYANFDWDTDTDSKQGGLLSAKRMPLNMYIAFAYKIQPQPIRNPVPDAPKWVSTECFDIDARGPADATKDQMRLMMRSLLADRFRLTAHWEPKTEPILILSLVKPGKLGPELHPDSDPTPCGKQPPRVNEPMATVAGGYPAYCGGFIGSGGPGGENLAARMTIATLVKYIGSSITLGFNRPVLDKTGLSGTFDMKISYTVDALGSRPQSADFQVAFIQALKDQLGLKLESTTGPVNELVVDHIEEPTPN